MRPEDRAGPPCAAPSHTASPPLPIRPPAPPRHTFEVAIIGGGPAGSTAAALLARAGRSVLLCDAARFPRHKICGEYIPPAAGPILARLGLREAIARLNPRRPTGMAVIAPDGTKVHGHFGAGREPGFTLRRYDFDALLLDNARASGAVVRDGSRVTGLRRRPDGWFDVDFLDSTVTARVVIGADGRNSLVGRRLGLKRAAMRHRRWAIMGHFRDVDAAPDHGEMIVTPYGYCGINALPGGLANVCIVVDPRREQVVTGGDGIARSGLPGRPSLPFYLKYRLESHPQTRRRMMRARLIEGPWAIGPMACRTSRSFTDGALLIGDAAGFYDPFTGEGITMALRGAEMAAAVLLVALSRDDVSANALRPYEVIRWAAFAPRLRLDCFIQALLKRPRLTGWVARRLRRDPRLADLLVQVAGDTADASEVFRPRFVTRLLLA